MTGRTGIAIRPAAVGPSAGRWWPEPLDALLYAGIVALYVLPFVGQRDLYYRDESRYGGIVLEMMRNDAWLTLTIPGSGPYLDKPPLFFALLRLAAEAAGTTAPWLFMAVVALTAAFYVAAGHVFLRAAGFDRATARTASLMLLAVPWIAFHMNMVRMDLLFSGLILLSAAALARGLDRDQPNRRTVLGGLLAAGAVLVKGPFGAALPLATLVAYLALRGRAGRLVRRDALAALAALALPVAAWFAVLAFAFGGGALASIFGDQVVERAVSGRDAQRAWWLYLLWTPLTLLPWLLLAPVLATRLGRAAISEGVARAGDPAALRRGAMLAAALVAVTFVILTAVAQRSVHYLLPLVPGLFVFVALVYRPLERAAPRLFDWFYLVQALAVLVAPPLVLLAAAALPPDRLDELTVAVPWASLVRAAGAMSLAAIPLALAARLRGEGRLAGSIAAVAVLLLAVKAHLMDDIGRLYSPAPTAAMVEQAVPAGGTVIIYDIHEGTMSYHLDRPHRHAGSVQALRAARAEVPDAFVLTSERTWRRRPGLFKGLAPVGTGRLETDLVLLGSRQ